MSISKRSKQLGLQEIYIHMGMFDFAIYCIVGDYEKSLQYVAWKFEEDSYDGENLCRGYAPRGQCLFKRGYTPIVWIPGMPTEPREYGTLAHECIHAVMHMFDWADLPSNAATEEVLTHAVAHLVNEILKKRIPDS